MMTNEFTQTSTEHDFEAPEIHLSDYLIVLYRRKWVALFAFVAVIAAVAFYLIYSPPVPMYEATSKIVIAPGALQEIVPGAPRLQNLDLVTQIEIIKTSPVLGKVIQQLGLSNAEEGTLAFKEAVDDLRDSLTIKFVGETLIATITATDPDPRLARDTANAVAQAYIDYDRTSRLQSGREAVAWLTEEIADISTKLKNAEKVLQDFKEREGIVTLDIKQSEDTAELTKLNANYISVKSKRIELEAILKHLTENALTITEIPDSVLVTQGLQNLNAQLVNLQTQLAEKQKIFKEKYPAIIKLQSDIEFINQKLRAELQEQLKALKTQEDILLNAWNAKKSEVLNLGKKDIEYLNLERDVTINKGLYDSLLMKMKDFSLVDNSNLSNIRILEYAGLPTIPTKNKKVLTIVLGVVLGLMLGIGSAFFLEYMDRSIRTPDDVYRHLGLSVLGLVPMDKKAQKASPPPLIATDENRSATMEAYYTLGTNFLLSRASNENRAPQTVLVTSAGPGEGKSMTASNLGTVLACMGWRVLLIDADLRRPVLHRVFEVNRLKGLSAVFNNEMTIEEAIVETSIPKLKILPAGPTSPNPVVILSSIKIKEIFAQLREDYDFILIDSAPLLGLADGMALANLVDAVLLVIKAGSTPSKPVEMAVRQLQGANVNLQGVVLNNVNLSRDRYYYYHYYYYSDYTKDSVVWGESERPEKVNKRQRKRETEKKEYTRIIKAEDTTNFQWMELNQILKDTLELPISESEYIAPEPTTVEEAPKVSEQLSLLVIDENAHIREILMAFLEDKYTIDGVASGEEGLQYLAQKDYDILITDLGMPGMNGYEVARRAKTIHPDIPVILMTGWGVEISDENLRENQIESLLPKPFDFQAVQDIITIAAEGRKRDKIEN